MECTKNCARIPSGHPLDKDATARDHAGEELELIAVWKQSYNKCASARYLVSTSLDSKE